MEIVKLCGMFVTGLLILMPMGYLLRVPYGQVERTIHINDNNAYVVLATAIQRCLDKHCADL